MPEIIASGITSLAGFGILLCISIFLLKRLVEFIEDLISAVVSGVAAIFWLLLIGGIIYIFVH